MLLANGIRLDLSSSVFVVPNELPGPLHLDREHVAIFQFGFLNVHLFPLNWKHLGKSVATLLPEYLIIGGCKRFGNSRDKVSKLLRFSNGK